MTYIPAIVMTADATDSAVLALEENIQRENLNYIEEAEAFCNLITEHGLTQEELAESGGKVVLRGAPAAHPVRMDREQMYRVLTNLKENALRYAGADPLVLTLTVWRQGNRECLRFADNGRGVPPEQQGRRG